MVLNECRFQRSIHAAQVSDLVYDLATGSSDHGGEPGRSSDATQCRVGPSERGAKGEQHCGERHYRK
jgi:hypothetical protein